MKNIMQQSPGREYSRTLYVYDVLIYQTSADQWLGQGCEKHKKIPRAVFFIIVLSPEPPYHVASEYGDFSRVPLRQMPLAA